MAVGERFVFPKMNIFCHSIIHSFIHLVFESMIINKEHMRDWAKYCVDPRGEINTSSIFEEIKYTHCY
jgi:hypothetical protein